MILSSRNWQEAARSSCRIDSSSNSWRLRWPTWRSRKGRILADSYTIWKNTQYDFLGTSRLRQDQVLESNNNCRCPIKFWGLPFSSLVNVIANRCRSESNRFRFVSLSACTFVADVKEAVAKAKSDLNLVNRQTVLFIDEIHRFNKLQQVIFFVS